MWRDACVELANQLGRDPDELVDWWAERASIREVDGGQARDDAERDAFDELRASIVTRRGPRRAQIDTAAEAVLIATTPTTKKR